MLSQQGSGTGDALTASPAPAVFLKRTLVSGDLIESKADVTGG